MTATIEELDGAVLLSVLSEVEHGDFSVRMPLGWTGVAGKIADRLNNIIAANETLGGELVKVSRVVGKEGKLSQRLALRGSDQVWFAAAESVNSQIEDLARPTSQRDAARGWCCRRWRSEQEDHGGRARRVARAQEHGQSDGRAAH